MTVIYRTTGAWGAGKGSNLTAAEVDGNFYDHELRIDALETSRPQPDEFASVATVGDQLTFYLQSGVTLGSVTMPTLVWQWRGEWLPFTMYAALDTFSVSGQGIFMVLLDHTSDATFDPDALSGSDPIYKQLIGVGTNAALDDIADVDVSGAAANAMLVAVSSGSPAVLTWEDRTPAQVTALLDTFSGDAGVGGAKGLVPAPAAGDAAANKFLRSGGNWANPTISEIGGLGANVAAFLAGPSSANLAAAVTGETGSGALVFGTGPSLDGATLTGTTALPDSGQINSSGDIGIGGAPAARLDLAGTYTTANAQFARVGGTLASSVIGTQSALVMNTIFNPSGASLGAAYAINGSPALSGSSSLNISTFGGFVSQLETKAGYSGTVATGAAFLAFSPLVGGTNPITVFSGFHAGSFTNGNGITSGTVTNRGIFVAGHTAAAAAGGTVSNRGAQITVPTGSGAGTVTNYGIYINGNGGSGGAGSTTNWALFSDSTAPSLLSGEFGLAAGKALAFKTGTGARAGEATLVGGTVTVTNTTVTANTKVLLSRKTIGGTAGNLTYTLSAGASFTINSSSGTDTSVITYMLLEVN